MELTPISEIFKCFKVPVPLFTFFCFDFGFGVFFGELRGGCVCFVWFWWLGVFCLLVFKEKQFALLQRKAVAQCLQNTATSDNPHGGQKACAKRSSATGLILIRVLDK